MYSGLPCLQGEVTANMSHPFKDSFPLTQFAAFAPKANAVDYTCRPPRIGVPGGLAYRRCDDKDKAFADFKPGKEIPPEQRQEGGEGGSGDRGERPRPWPDGAPRH